MSHPDAIQKIVILGGGTAGWMTAATLAHLLDANRVSVTLIESEQIGTVGVGEATIPPILLFNQMLGIDEKAFIRETKATFKLGIEFVNWGGLGEAYIHPFGDFATDIETLPMHHHWLRAKAAGYDRNLFDFSLMVQACRRGRFVHPVTNNPRSVLAGVHYAYQFDASLYAAYLRSYAEQRGVKRVEGRVASVDQNSETGFVESLKLEDGQSVDGEFFIDCSGFRGILIEQTLNCGYQDWSHWLPCNRAVAAPCEKTSAILPYTKSTAKDAGWQWRIPLQHRTGNGYVYCDAYLDSDTAEQSLLSSLDGDPIAAPKHLKFVTGRRNRFWNKNCVAIGLAAGFMEPLESTSLHLIQYGIMRLLALFPNKAMSPLLAEEYNALTIAEYERIRDFLILHYTATQRDDSEFWRYCANMPIPDRLAYKMEHFRTHGMVISDERELFHNPSWIAVYLGQDILPERAPAMTEHRVDVPVQERFQAIRTAMTDAVNAMPPHETFIERYCKSDLQ